MRLLYVGPDDDRFRLVQQLSNDVDFVHCSLTLENGPWSVIIIAAEFLLAHPDCLPKTPETVVMAYGPENLLRSAWHWGVFDYLKEPWTAEELWLRAVGFRSSPCRWSWQGQLLHLVGESLQHPSGRSTALTALEVRVLSLLLRRPGSLIATEVLEQELYGGQTPPHSRVLAVIISNLRTKIRDLCQITNRNPILSERKRGYWLL